MATKLQTVEGALSELPTDTLHAAMARAFAEIDAATKDATNPHFKSKYADLSAIIAAIKPPLVANGLFFTQRCQPAEDGVSVETVLHHRGGEQLSLGTLYMPANKRDPQGFGSALTYCKRYGLQTAFGVPTEDDDGNDGSKSAQNRATTGEPKPRAPVKYEGGPYTCPTQLMAAARQFVHTLNGLSDYAEYLAWAKTPDVRDFVKQLKKEMPDWWSGGPDVPGDFVPLEILTAQKERDLQELDEIKTREAAE